jgi:flagellar assembly factor FliW
MLKKNDCRIDQAKAVFDAKRFINFPEGLPAFETVNNFVIVANEEEAPFLWLQAADLPDLAFIVIDPFLIAPDYRPDISDADIRSLEIEEPDDAFILSIVTIQSGGSGITANLVSPVLINTRKHMAKQVILNNHRDYSVHFRIDEANNAEG